MPISLAETIARVDRGIAKAKESGLLVSFAVIDGGQLEGAIGVSGATAQQDDELAKHCCGAIASP